MSTTTLTLTARSAPPVPVLHLTRKGCFSRLFEQLREIPPPHWEESQREIFESCAAQMERQGDLSSNEAREAYSTTLCYLRRKVLCPLLESVGGCEPLENSLLASHDLLLETLTSTLPEGETLKGFMRKYDQYEGELESHQRERERILESFQEELAEIERTAGTLNREREVRCEALKQKLRGIQGIRRRDVELIETQLDVLQKQIESSASDLTLQAAESAAIAKGMLRAREGLDRQLAECGSMLGRLRA